MLDKQKDKLTESIAEARAIASWKNFAGPANRAVFWGHTTHSSPYMQRIKASPLKLNNLLAKNFVEQSKVGFYRMNELAVRTHIEALLDKFNETFDEEASEPIWSIFSETFAKSASGDTITVAVNDMDQDYWFLKAEFPHLRGRFSRVNVIEPDVLPTGDLEFRSSSWYFKDWLPAQKAQWKKPYHFLDGTPYPKEIIPQGI